MTPTPATLPQTIVLLAISRGERHYMPPITRNSLLAKRWIAVSGTETRPDGSARKFYAVTEAGARALATSPRLAEATRKLDAGRKAMPWQGLT